MWQTRSGDWEQRQAREKFVPQNPSSSHSACNCHTNTHRYPQQLAPYSLQLKPLSNLACSVYSTPIFQQMPHCDIVSTDSVSSGPLMGKVFAVVSMRLTGECTITCRRKYYLSCFHLLFNRGLLKSTCTFLVRSLCHNYLWITITATILIAALVCQGFLFERWTASLVSTWC